MKYTEHNPLKVQSRYICITTKSYKEVTLLKKLFTGVILNDVGDLAWYENGKLSRRDGIAVIHADGSPGNYYIDGVYYSKDNFKHVIQQNNLTTPEYFKNLL